MHRTGASPLWCALPDDARTGLAWIGDTARTPFKPQNINLNYSHPHRIRFAWRRRVYLNVNMLTQWYPFREYLHIRIFCTLIKDADRQFGARSLLYKKSSVCQSWAEAEIRFLQEIMFKWQITIDLHGPRLSEHLPHSWTSSVLIVFYL